MSDFADGSYPLETSKQYPKLVAFWKMVSEYIQDYLSGNKHKRLHTNQDKTK